MKKEYKKPSVFIQDMVVNSFAAGLCKDNGKSLVYYTENTCTVTDEESGSTFFGDNCTGDEFSFNVVHPNPQSPFAQLCYHRPEEATSFFFAS